MRIERVTLDGQVLKLCLEYPDTGVYNLVRDFRPGEYEVRKIPKRRSLTANAYLWKLIHEIAAKLQIPDEEVYKQTVRSSGKKDTICVQDKALDGFVSLWNSRGTGWFTETEPAKIPGCTVVHLYYGSSVYDVQEMSRLIDAVVQDAKALGIETRPQEEVEAMLTQWQ